ncbi:hypothetical protein EHQ53_12260 [Leptospira langatensis]|uniref:Uncharacterized protein n=1 Tax=Leptospira langatensis TaxID=2484983 RepID=A0A5F1ZSJ7_9LEPT|nr:hypothetical protein [Leptospira langatensis]TGJ98686.1 hypothetical protein EHO57_14245 [Leptospira langatensis]TGL40748.1 hypothetical protein EHQ53_12260 [Leptospira langatensis]
MTNYYLVGSKYGEHNNVDIFPELYRRSVISVGFADEIDLSHLYLATEEEIINYLSERGEPKSSCNALKKFLQIKLGDVVAIKSSGNPKNGVSYLGIQGYAVVVERDGRIYFHDSNELGHCLHVEYFDTDFRELSIGGYAQTIHLIEDLETINSIFGQNVNFANPEIRKNAARLRFNRRIASSEVNTNPQSRKGGDDYITNPIHNKIQSIFGQKLKKIYGSEKVNFEIDFVDITLELDNEIYYYEVKPFAKASSCIKNGLGQLLVYASRYSGSKKLKLRIVGPYPVESEEISLIQFIKSSINFDFEYIDCQIENDHVA